MDNANAHSSMNTAFTHEVIVFRTVPGVRGTVLQQYQTTAANVDFQFAALDIQARAGQIDAFTIAPISALVH